MSFDKHGVTNALLVAYRATRYRVFARDGELVLRIGEYNAAFAKLLENTCKTRGAILTAWNPRSRREPMDENQMQQSKLLRELQDAGLCCMPGLNEACVDFATHESWNEESVLVLDVDIESARTIAARYGQLAFVWIDQHATPRLEFTAAGVG